MQVTWKARIKEKGNASILTPVYVCSESVSGEYVIKFFGLENDDVEWYELECWKNGSLYLYAGGQS